MSNLVSVRSLGKGWVMSIGNDDYPYRPEAELKIHKANQPNACHHCKIKDSDFFLEWHWEMSKKEVEKLRTKGWEGEDPVVGSNGFTYICRDCLRKMPQVVARLKVTDPKGYLKMIYGG